MPALTQSSRPIGSILFVPADSERKAAKAAKAAELGADALAFDLEGSVLPERKPIVRQMLAQFLTNL